MFHIRTKYIRIQTRYCGKTGKPVGIFGACSHLQRAERLTDKEVELFLQTEDWFNVHLPNPPFYQDGNTDKAITWFKTHSTQEMLIQLQPLIDLLDKYQVEYDIVFNAYQVAVV